MGPAEEQEFREFVVARLERLRRTAYLLCRDWHAADDLVSITIGKLHRRWRRARAATNLDAYARGVLTNAWLDERRRPWRREAPVAEPPDKLPYCPVLEPEDWGDWPQFWAATGLAVGELATITVTMTRAVAVTDRASTLPTLGTFALAVAERVRFEDYPLPPAPAPLPRLEPSGAQFSYLELHADPADPNRRVEREFRWEGLELTGCDVFGLGAAWVFVTMVSQTPGFLRVSVNRVEVARYESWDYRQRLRAVDLGGVCLEVGAGDLVTVTVEPEHLAGDWRVALHPVAGLPAPLRQRSGR